MSTTGDCESAGSTGHSGTDWVAAWYLQTAVPPQHSQFFLDNCYLHILQWMITANQGHPNRSHSLEFHWVVSPSDCPVLLHMSHSHMSVISVNNQHVKPHIPVISDNHHYIKHYASNICEKWEHQNSCMIPISINNLYMKPQISQICK